MSMPRQLQQEAKLVSELQSIENEMRQLDDRRRKVRRQLAVLRAKIDAEQREVAVVFNPADPLTDRIVTLLDQTPESSWTAEQIDEILNPGSSRASLSTTLASLAREGRIRRPNRGRYCSVYSPRRR